MKEEEDGHLAPLGKEQEGSRGHLDLLGKEEEEGGERKP